MLFLRLGLPLWKSEYSPPQAQSDTNTYIFEKSVKVFQMNALHRWSHDSLISHFTWFVCSIYSIKQQQNASFLWNRLFTHLILLVVLFLPQLPQNAEIFRVFAHSPYKSQVHSTTFSRLWEWILFIRDKINVNSNEILNGISIQWKLSIL